MKKDALYFLYTGDGFVITRHLDNHEKDIHILLFTDPDDLKDDTKINYNILQKSHIAVTSVNETNFEMVNTELLSKADWIVDALFGTGLEGEVKDPYKKFIEAINRTTAIILAVDIPSGLDCDTGKPLGVAVKATYTFTVACLKLGFMQPEANEFLGDVHIVDIGTP